MATPIEIKYCRHCGQMENMHGSLDVVQDVNVIRVWCACGKEEPRITRLRANEPYFLAVETRMEEVSGDADSDSGNVQAGGEAGRQGDA